MEGRRQRRVHLGQVCALAREDQEQRHRRRGPGSLPPVQGRRAVDEAPGRTYRFSISWPRISPQGTGTPNPRGLEFHSRLADELLGNGIEPFATLYHWDLPQALQDSVGGRESRDTSKAFAEYAGYVAEKLSDRVKHLFTINEFTTFVECGHGTGVLASGLKLPPARLNQVRHHAVLAHGLAVQAIRAKARPGTKVGPAENITAGVPIIKTPEHIAAAERATRELNAGYLTVMLEGRYTDAFLSAAGADAPKFTLEDLKVIASPLDCDRIMFHVDDATLKRTPKLSASFYREASAGNGVM